MPVMKSRYGAAVGIEHAAALAAHEHDRLPLVGLQNVLRLERLDVVRCRSIMSIVSNPPFERAVPAISAASRGLRPLAIATSPTPPFRATRHARSFATMPAVAVPDRTSSSIARPSSDPIVVPLGVEHAGGAAGNHQTRGFRPGRPGRRRRVSAFTLNKRPSRAAPIEAITGVKPFLHSASISGAPLPATGSPTRPRSTSSPLVARCGFAGLTASRRRLRPSDRPHGRPPR